MTTVTVNTPQVIVTQTDNVIHVSVGSANTTHGSLLGLTNDDHSQYHTDARGDIRYYTKPQVNALVSGATIDTSAYYTKNEVNTLVSGVSSGVTDHGLLTGLADDDHTQYHNDTRGDIRYYTKGQVDTLVSGVTGVTDHGALTGLADDDHPQYVLVSALSESIDDRVATFIQNGTGITWDYNDVANTLTPTVTVSGGGGGGATGTAGGDLSGTYPNPSVVRINGVTLSGVANFGRVPMVTVSGVAEWVDAQGMTNPMSGIGDIIIGVAGTGTGNVALTSLGATITTRDTWSGTATAIIDGSDATFWEGLSPNANSYAAVTLATARVINQFRVYQAHDNSRSQVTKYYIQSSNNGTQWITRHTVTSAPKDSGVVSLSSGAVLARYWRVFTDSAETGDFGWALRAFELHTNTGTINGTASRLAIGSTGQFLTVVSGLPAWSNTIVAATSSTVPLDIKRATSQSVDIVRILDTDGTTVLHRINKDGYAVIKKTSAPADADLSANEVALWFDATAGAAKLKIKGKNASGTVVSGEVALT
jgi:hypothetical protein